MVFSARCDLDMCNVNVIWFSEVKFRLFGVGLITALVRIRFQRSPCEVCSGQSGAGRVFIVEFRFSLPSAIPPLWHTI